MRFRFLSLGFVGLSLLTGSVFSAKLIEIHINLTRPSEARPTAPSPPVQSFERPERISFRRGTFGQTLSGAVTQSKSYLLEAKDGQYLSATLSSSNNCVVFNSGSATVNFATVSGNNSLTIVNNCGGTSRFSLAVEIR